MKNIMQKYADKYFLRSNEILKADNLNPWVNMQVFARKGPGKVAGLDEAVEVICSNSDIEKVGGRIYAKKDGEDYNPKETIMNIIAPIQSIMELETIYLGVISAGITLENRGSEPSLESITRNVEKVVELVGNRPVLYFGARHWHYSMDKDISAAAFKGGASSCSTDAGAEAFGKQGIGTIPHALENIYAYFFGKYNAVARSTEAFDRVIGKSIPRIALCDYNNREITDTLQTIYMLESGNGLTKRLDGVRIDTCGENIAEGGSSGYRKYWQGNGVTVEGVYALRKALDLSKNRHIGITLSSGFSDPEKIKAFNEGEAHYKTKLYDAIGAGFLDDVITATADIVSVGDSPEAVEFYGSKVSYGNIMHKAGRFPKPNPELGRII